MALNEKLAALPDDTVVYCGHEYTAAKSVAKPCQERVAGELIRATLPQRRLLEEDRPGERRDPEARKVLPGERSLDGQEHPRRREAVERVHADGLEGGPGRYGHQGPGRGDGPAPRDEGEGRTELPRFPTLTAPFAQNKG